MRISKITVENFRSVERVVRIPTKERRPSWCHPASSLRSQTLPHRLARADK